jgi:hypothetical protein
MYVSTVPDERESFSVLKDMKNRVLEVRDASQPLATSLAKCAVGNLMAENDAQGWVNIAAKQIPTTRSSLLLCGVSGTVVHCIAWQFHM